MAKAKKKTPMKQTSEGQQSFLDLGFTIPGIAFRWINGDVRNQMQSWAHWSAVARDSELGQKIAEKLSSGHAKFDGGNEDSNYFRRGQLILAWADEEVALAHRKALDDKADARLRQVVNPKEGVSLRQSYIGVARK